MLNEMSLSACFQRAKL